MNRTLILLLLVFACASCSKRETPIVLPPKGEASLMEVNMGENYDFQLYVSLEKQEVVHTSKTDSWDMAFQAGRFGKEIYINEAKGMSVYRTAAREFNQVSLADTSDVIWRQDEPDGLPGGSAFGDWSSIGHNEASVYIVRMDVLGTAFKKIRCISVSDGDYLIEVGDIQSSSGTEFVIKKDFNRNYVYFDLSLLSQVEDIEPPSNTYDLIFTRYGYTFYDQNPPLPYVVTGVLLNPQSTLAYKDSTQTFYDLTGAFCSQIEFSNAQDVIGFDWKTYSVDKGLYVVNQSYNYLIRTQSENYYKLRFLDFYNEDGVKGHPTFEFHQIL